MHKSQKKSKRIIYYAYHASESHNPNSMFALAYLIKKSKLYKKDFKDREFLNWLTRAADAGQANAQVELGAAYLKGEGVVQDGEKGVSYIQRAADAGSSAAQFFTGSFYADGKHVPKDIERAIQYLTLAADAGHVEAQERLFAIGHEQMMGERKKNKKKR